MRAAKPNRKAAMKALLTVAAIVLVCGIGLAAMWSSRIARSSDWSDGDDLAEGETCVMGYSKKYVMIGRAA